LAKLARLLPQSRGRRAIIDLDYPSGRPREVALAGAHGDVAPLAEVANDDDAAGDGGIAHAFGLSLWQMALFAVEIVVMDRFLPKPAGTLEPQPVGA
jgi:hypothetical protein